MCLTQTPYGLKFGGNLIWWIGLQFQLVHFNLVVLFLRGTYTGNCYTTYTLYVTWTLRPVQMFDRGVDSANMEAEPSYVRGHHVYKRTWVKNSLCCSSCRTQRYPLPAHTSLLHSLSEREGTFIGCIRRSLVKYLYNTIFKLHLYSDTRFQTPPTKCIVDKY